MAEISSRFVNNVTLDIAPVERRGLGVPEGAPI